MKAGKDAEKVCAAQRAGLEVYRQCSGEVTTPRVEDLKALLGGLGLPKSGKKDALIARIRVHQAAMVEFYGVELLRLQQGQQQQQPLQPPQQPSQPPQQRQQRQRQSRRSSSGGSSGSGSGGSSSGSSSGSSTAAAAAAAAAALMVERVVVHHQHLHMKHRPTVLLLLRAAWAV
jgi:uncharacterized membrane protein YgcG